MFFIHLKFDNTIIHINEITRNVPDDFQSLSVQKCRHKVKFIPAF